MWGKVGLLTFLRRKAKILLGKVYMCDRPEENHYIPSVSLQFGNRKTQQKVQEFLSFLQHHWYRVPAKMFFADFWTKVDFTSYSSKENFSHSLSSGCVSCIMHISGLSSTLYSGLHHTDLYQNVYNFLVQGTPISAKCIHEYSRRCEMPLQKFIGIQ